MLMGGVAVGIVASGAIGIGLAQTAGASDGSIEIDGSTFHTYTQLESAWAASVGEFNENFPEGEAVSDELPRFFDDVDKEGLFEASLLDSLVADLWQCSWLDVATSAAASPAELREATQQLELWEELPVLESFDVESYQASIEDAAEAQNITPEEYEFKTLCVGYEEDLA